MDRRSAIKHVVGAVGAAKLWGGEAFASANGIAGAHRIQTPKVAVYLSPQAEITGLVLTPPSGAPIAVRALAKTVLAGCKVKKASSKRIPGGFEFVKELVHSPGGDTCDVTERFVAGKSGSVRWEIEIRGDGGPWSAPIETHVSWPADSNTTFWTAWGDSRLTDSPGWIDPLMPAKFAERSLHYGGSDVTKNDGFSLPIVTVLDAARDAGLSVVLDPNDSVIEMDLKTTAAGEIVFSRTNSRISKDRAQKFAVDLIAHPGDWRAGLGWMVARYPEQFDPPTPVTFQVAGNGSYSEYEADDLDAYKLHSMGFRVNWKASFDYYTMGFFIPPVGDDVQFIAPRPDDGTADFPTSIAHLREYSEQMRRAGFYVLNYFNVGQFGFGLKTDAPPPRRAQSDADLWRDPNDFAWYVLRDAFLYEDDGRVRHGSQSDIRMDVGEPVYMRFMLEQARLHIEKFPASAGLALDEMQFERNYNTRRDDGLTWRNGKPARAMVNSWKDWMDQLGPLMSKANKVIYANPLYRRLDLMRHLDGFFDEFAYAPYSLNAVCLMALRKPYVGWTIDIDDPDPDSYFQRHLHLGAYISAPYPMNNHEIMPSGSRVDRYFVDYGPMFEAMRGRTWFLAPHAIELEGQRAKANLFEIPGAYLAFVTFAGESETVRITLRGLTKLPNQAGFRIESIRPGESEWESLGADERADTLTLNVPVKRGCAAVKLSFLWVKPEKHCFVKDHTVHLETTLTDVQIHYTLDGPDPGESSAVYSEPLNVITTTMLKSAAFRGGTQIGPVLTSELVKTLPPAPWIDPFRGTFGDFVKVEIRSGFEMDRSEIRYTLDGSEVTPQSPLYSGPFEISCTTTVRTRSFVPSLEPSVTASRVFTKLPPPVPSPEVHLSDLTPSKFLLVWHKKPKKDLSFMETPLSLGGRKFSRGVGVASPAELVYKLEPDYGTFVAVAGLDDNVKGRYADMATFRVFARNAREELLLHESPMLYPGEVWPIAVKIPIGCFEMRLEASGGMDGEYVDWASAGFLLDRSNQGAELLKAIDARVAK